MIQDYVCVDIETTGVNSKWNKIIEIGALKVRNGKTEEVFSELIDPGVKLPYYITNLTGITDDMLAGKRTIEEVLPDFIAFAGDDILMGHNLMFDYGFLKQNAMNLEIPFDKHGIDTLKIARKTLPHLESRALSYLCDYYAIEDENHHRALNDATVTSRLYQILTVEFGNDYAKIFEPYPLLYSVKKLQPITEKQKKYLKALMNFHGMEITFDMNSLTKNEASRKIDKIISEKGRISARSF